jgi:hypothetical protein
MPVSEKKLTANRANAQKSTGPRHKKSYLAKAILIAGESSEHFYAFLESVYKEFSPVTPTELVLVDKMAVAQWRTLRLWAIESASINHEINRQSAGTPNAAPSTRAMLAMRALGDSSKQSELLSRYEHRYDRQYSHALETLLRLREKNAGNAKATELIENKELAS